MSVLFVCHTENHLLRSCLFAKACGFTAVTIAIPRSSSVDERMIKGVRIGFPAFKCVEINDCFLNRFRKFFRYLMWFKCNKLVQFFISVFAPSFSSQQKRLIRDSTDYYIFNDSVFLSELIMHMTKNVSLIQEGVVNLLPLDRLYGKYEVKLLAFLGRHYRLGRSRYIQSVYFDKSIEVPEDLSSKARFIDLSFDHFNNEELKSFLPADLPFLSDSSAHCVVFVLQNMSRARATVSQVLRWYEQVVSLFSSFGYTLLVKAHPQDRIDYSSINGPALLPAYLPIEILMAVESSSIGALGVTLLESSVITIRDKRQWLILMPDSGRIIESITYDELNDSLTILEQALKKGLAAQAIAEKDVTPPVTRKG